MKFRSVYVRFNRRTRTLRIFPEVCVSSTLIRGIASHTRANYYELKYLDEMNLIRQSSVQLIFRNSEKLSHCFRRILMSTTVPLDHSR